MRGGSGSVAALSPRVGRGCEQEAWPGGQRVPEASVSPAEVGPGRARLPQRQALLHMGAKGVHFALKPWLRF